MEWIVIVVILLLGLTVIYSHQLSVEGYADYIGDIRRPGLDVTDVGLSSLVDGPILRDFIPMRQGLTAYTAEACAAIDRSRETELGGQYVQRTNNYKRDFPDNCSAPLTEFVGSTYEPSDGVGLTVPCAGSC